MRMAEKPRVFVTDFIAEPCEIERRILGDIADVVALDVPDESHLPGKIDDAAAIMMYHCVRMSAPLIKRLQNCKLIIRCGVGYDNIDISTARAQGIPVANVPDYGTEEVADSAIGMSLALARGFNLHNVRLQRGEGQWTHQAAVPLRRLRGRIFGIVGLGRIGCAVALRAKALGMNVVFYDPFVPDGKEKALGVRRVDSLDELLAKSYILSVHCPGTEETRSLIDTEAISKMSQGSYLINTARGFITEPNAILEALTCGHLAGAAIDVLPEEPPPADSLFLSAWRDPAHPASVRLILNPHSAFYSEEGMEDMRIKGSENCRRALLGIPLRNIVNDL